MRWKACVAALAASWGFISIIVARVGLDASVLVFYRLALAVLTVGLGLVVARRTDLLRLPSRRGILVALGVILAAHWFLYFETIKVSSVVVAVLTVYTAPIFIALAAPIFLHESRSRIALAALVPAAVGLALIVLAGGKSIHATPLAVALGLGAGASYAALVICTKQLRLDVHPATIHFWATLVAALSLAPFLALAPRVLPRGPAATAGVLCVGIVFTGISGLVYITLLGKVTAQAAGILAFLEPVSASFLAWALLGEQLSVAVVLGGVLVLAAGTFVVFDEPRDAAAVEVPGLGSTQ
jgi:drug/metabolite transporter (DMT)-like permease